MDMDEALKEKVTEEHKVIDEAIRDKGEGYTVFSIPVGILYRPPENKMRNAKPKDYLGKAKLVAAENPAEAYTTFTGATRMAQGFSPTGAPLDRPAGDQSLSVGPTNLAPSASFSRARNPETVRPIERAGSATARLERQNTTIQVNGVREAANLQKSNTIGSRNIVTPPARAQTTSPTREGGNASPPPGQGSGPAGQGGGAAGLPMRGLSLRTKQDLPPVPGGSGRPGGPGGQNSRLTDIYDDYLGEYGEEEPPLPDDSGKVRAWASRTQPGPPTGPSRPVTRAPSAYNNSRSQFGGSNAPRRRPTRQNTYGGRSRSSTRYEGEEEEGYGSGEFEEGFELIRIKVKIHYNGEVRGMALTPDMPYEEFLDRVHSKFNKTIGEMSMKFIDEDGMKVSLRDDSDYDLAIETARDSAKGKPDGKLVVWVE